MVKDIFKNRDMEYLEKLFHEYKNLYENPENSRPMIIINVPARYQPTWQEQLADPLVMLNAQLEQIRMHIELGDDYAPAVRINFGTGQVAAAFGCELIMVENSLPAVKSSLLKHPNDIYNLLMPDFEAGWYRKLAKWNDIWLENLPSGVAIQHPDIQSPFNTAHLIRGNDILTDFYDAPEAVEHLLDTVTDYMIKLVSHFKAMIRSDKDWFFDWSAMWKGSARISNCSNTMISPDLYKQYVFPRDCRFLDTIGGGRIHYCGSSGKVISNFFEIPSLTGLDCDCQYHDLWSLSQKTPSHVTLIFQQYGAKFPFTEKLLKGDWPDKRNIIVITEASSIEEGRILYQKLRESISD